MSIEARQDILEGLAAPDCKLEIETLRVTIARLGAAEAGAPGCGCTLKFPASCAPSRPFWSSRRTPRRKAEMTLEAEYQEGVVTVSYEDAVLTVTLNRPDKLNSIDHRVVNALIDIQRSVAERRDVHVVVLRGAGRVFSAGADLHHIDSIYKDPQRSRRYLSSLRDACVGLEHLRQPVVAAVHGMVLAGGLELMLACDLVVAEDSTRIGDQHMNWGFIAGGGSTQRLPRWIGPARARDLLYTGRWVSAREAWEMGLVSRVVDDGSLASATAELAEDLAKRSPDAMARTKALVRHSQEVPLEQGLDLEIETVMSYYANPGFEAAMTGFKTRTAKDFRKFG